jgi:hypothetical protein
MQRDVSVSTSNTARDCAYYFLTVAGLLLIGIFCLGMIIWPVVAQAR